MAYLKFRTEGKKRDYQKIGNYNNWLLSLIKSPKDSVLTFYGEFTSTSNWTYIKAVNISIADGIETIINEVDLTNDLTILQDGAEFSHVAEDHLSTNLAKGVYYLEISNGDSTLQSELFCVNSEFNVFNLFLLTNQGKLLTNNDKLLINYNTIY